MNRRGAERNRDRITSFFILVFDSPHLGGSIGLDFQSVVVFTFIGGLAV